MALVVAACVLPRAGSPQGRAPEAAAPPGEPAGREPSIFVDAARDAGLDFRHFNGMTGRLYFPEMTGQGGALFDFDGDGDLDVYLVQGSMLGGHDASDAVFPWAGPAPPSDRLFRNDVEVRPDGSRTLRFTDVSGSSGIGAGAGYAMGVATGDYDGDGRVDLYLTAYGPNRLLRNLGGGRFEDVTASAGVDDGRWSTSATFFDYDRDGRLDLFVVNYVDYRVEHDVACFATSSRRDYCGPSSFPPQGDRLFRNVGDGRFENVTERALGSHEAGAGLGVVASDLDGDGWVDLYVANDGLPNHLWLGGPDGRFREEALMAGVALSQQGAAEASMGIAAGDFDADGDEDLFLTHLQGETNTLYVNLSGGLFEDRTALSGLAAPSRPRTGFGTGWIDYDGDGWLDLLVLNGAVRLQESGLRQGNPYPLGQPNQLFRNLGDGRFAEVSDAAGEVFGLEEVSRGAAFGDVDDDGDLDVLVLNNAGPVRLLLDQRQDGHWLGLRLLEAQGQRDALGARAALLREGRPQLWRRARSDGSFASASDPRVLFGLGAAADVLAVRVVWPDGQVEVWDAPPVDAYTTLRQGTGRRVP
jgi:hypothetical protein